ncbi:MAG: chorismate-binding protein [Ferruginibacter sp.]|nr:chorismate-binding protein [Cytophagales bacterium]
MIELAENLLKRTADWLPALWHTATNERRSAALWRLPDQTEKHVLIDPSGDPPRVKVDLEELPAGFAFSPFLHGEEKSTWFLAAGVHVRFGAPGEPLALAFPNPGAQAAGEIFLSKAARYVAPDADPVLPLPDPVPADGAEKERYVRLVERAIEAIHAGQFQKVALSRSGHVALPADFDALRLFERLCRMYPRAFVSLVSVPGVGVWTGATPETLISVDRNGLFRTVSLAGTQPLRSGASVREAHWTHKEIEEQALVSRYIVNCFKKIRLREYEEEGPKTVVAGNLMHLRTDFRVDTQAVGFPQLGTVMLELLHPTSAVCGVPKVVAMDFIRQNEGYDRQFYSGFLGPVNVDRETHLFVNLRCLQLHRSTATVYAGAGITAESTPEKEWLETEAKCQTMLKAL